MANSKPLQALEWCVAAFSRAIAPFLDDDDAKHMKHTSRLWCITYGSLRCRMSNSQRLAGLLSFFQAQTELRRDLRALLLQHAKKKKRKQGTKLNDKQVHSLLCDLVLVGLGIRPSCLVDVCRLEKETLFDMLNAFASSKSWRLYGLHHLRVLSLSGNVFFVNTGEFVRLKCLDVASDLHTMALIDASAGLSQPHLLSSDADIDRKCRDELVDLLSDLVGGVVSSSFTSSASSCCQSQINVQPTAGSSTAMAGIILCYPVVYHVEAVPMDGAIVDDDPFWTTNANCLGMCPLHLFKLSITVHEITGGCDSPTLTLQEFSLPQHIQAPPGCNVLASVRQIERACRRSVEATISTSSDDIGAAARIDVAVEVSARTLPQVAL